MIHGARARGRQWLRVFERAHHASIQRCALYVPATTVCVSVCPCPGGSKVASTLLVVSRRRLKSRGLLSSFRFGGVCELLDEEPILVDEAFDFGMLQLVVERVRIASNEETGDDFAIAFFVRQPVTHFDGALRLRNAGGPNRELVVQGVEVERNFGHDDVQLSSSGREAGLVVAVDAGVAQFSPTFADTFSEDININASLAADGLGREGRQQRAVIPAYDGRKEWLVSDTEERGVDVLFKGATELGSDMMRAQLERGWRQRGALGSEGEDAPPCGHRGGGHTTQLGLTIHRPPHEGVATSNVAQLHPHHPAGVRFIVALFFSPNPPLSSHHSA